jgi:heavy metal efflux system protein
MIGKIVSFSLRNSLLVLILTFIMAFAGAVSFKRLPIEAYPDIADTWVQVITQWPGHAAEEIEQQITVPTEIVMNGVPHHTHLRSVSLFGLSVVTLIFDEETPAFLARQFVLERLPQAQLPQGVQANLGPMSSPVGQIYWYVLDSKDHSSMELKEIEDWDLEKRWKEVAGVADVSSFGGMVKQYQVLLSPLSLTNFGISTGNVVQSLSNNNQNSGGGFIPHGDQTFNVRGIGKASSISDIENTVVAEKNGTPIRVKNLGQVVIGEQTRLGKIEMSERLPNGTIDERDDVVEGIIVSRVGESDDSVLDGIHEKFKEISDKYLPGDIRIKPYLDRSELIRFTTHTVEENMVSGMILVLIILLLFLGNIRSALIVAVTIPLALLFASILLDLRKIPANLLSLGALDFGMIVDGAVVMVENIFRHKEARKKLGLAAADENIIELIIAAAREVERPIVYAIAIIILTYLPIFTLQRIEGRLFAPMAWTVGFALLGALILVLTVVPVLCAIFLRGELKEWHNPMMHWFEVNYRKALLWALERRRLIVGAAIGSFILTLILAFGGPIGSEFLPHLDEGSIWLRGTLPPSASYEMADSVVKKARKTLMKYEEVPIMVCQIGRPDDGTDATGFFNTECFVDLKQRGEWSGKYKTKDQLIAAMDADLKNIPGVIWNFSQPISDNIEEMMSGVKGELVVKIIGDDLPTLTKKAIQVKDVISGVRGIQDVGFFEEMGQPNYNIKVNRDQISRLGLNISDIQDVIETAVGGKAASQLMDGEKRFDIVVRYQPQYRDSIDHIKRIMVPTPDGYRIPLEELADIRTEEGASMIYRENNSRYAAIKFSVRDRDLGSTIEEAQAAVKKKVLLPPGYQMEWAGEFESQRRAERRLALVVPLTVLAIFFVLYLVFRSIKWALIVMADVMTARMGGVLALFLTGTNFSVSSGIGFLAVFGVSIQTGVLLVTYIHHMRMQGHSIRDAIIEGSCLRLRPIMMTALVATFGLLPAALSHAIGSDSQRPMAIVIVGGLVTDLVIAFFLLPTLYLWFAKPGDLSEDSLKKPDALAKHLV